MTSWTGQDDGATTYAELAERRRKLGELCERLGIDPAETVNVSVDVEPSAVVVRWEGVRRLVGTEAAQLVAHMVDAFPVEDDE